MCGDDANDAPALRQADSETWPIRLSSVSFAYEFRLQDLAWVDTGSRSDADFQKSNRTSIQARAVAIVESRLKTMTEKLQSSIAEPR
jgi:hypothetical protein